jgi:hypothetical protein
MKRLIPICTAAALFAALSAASCSSAPPSPPPLWHTDMEAGYPREQFIAEIGRGPTRESAETAGARAIARFFSMHITAQTREEASSVNGGATQSVITDSAFIDTQVELFALRYENWFDKAAKQWETVAYIDRAEAWKIYEPRLREKEAAFLSLFRGAQNEADVIRRYTLYRAAQHYYAKNFAPLRKFAGTLYPEAARAAFPQTEAALAELPRLAREALAKSAVYITCEGDYENTVARAFEQALGGAGFPVTKNKAGAAGTLAVTIRENAGETKERGFVFESALLAELTGASGAIFSFEAGLKQRVVTMTREAGVRRAYAALAQAVAEGFSAQLQKYFEGENSLDK